MSILLPVIITIAQATPNPFRDGPTIYAQDCMTCHGDQGQGSGGVPALSGNGAVTANNPNGVIAVVKHGRGAMPAYGKKLSDVEVASIVTYIRTAWGNEGTSVGVYQVDAVH